MTSQRPACVPSLAIVAMAMVWEVCCSAAAIAQDAAAPTAELAVVADGQSTSEFTEPATADEYAPAMPLLSYSRDGVDETNPLRPPTAAPPVAAAIGPETPTVEPQSAAPYQAAAPSAEFELGVPRYAIPVAANEPATADGAVPTDSTAAFTAATPPRTAEPAAQAIESTFLPAAPLEDDDAAPLVAYDAATSTPALPVSTPAYPSGSESTSRRLAPPSATRPSGGAPADGRSTKYSFVPTAFLQLKSLTSAGAGLAIVIGLFLICAWLLRRGGPKPTGVLPPEAFSVLGRAPLTAQSFAQLVRLGNKLVLVAVTADGAQPLAEVTDAAEVDRIAGLCIGNRGAGPSAEFQQVLAQLSREPTKGFLGREGSSARRRA